MTTPNDAQPADGELLEVAVPPVNSFDPRVVPQNSTGLPPLPPGYVSADDIAVDVDAIRAQVPADATMKGMFHQGLLGLLTAEERRAAFADAPQLVARRIAFKDYPVADFMDIALRVAAARMPHAPLPQALRALGRVNFRTFLQSLTGRVIFGVVGREIETLMRGTARAYELSQSHGRAQVLAFADDHVLMSYSGLYQFLPCVEVGVMEEAVISCGYNVAIALKLSSPSAGDVLVRYAKPS